MLVRKGPLTAEKDANYTITLIERDNSIILPRWRDHEDVIFMLDSSRNIKCSHTIGVFCVSYACESCCCHFSCTSFFSVDFRSHCFFSFLLPPPPALPSLPVTSYSPSPSKWRSEQLTHVQSLPSTPGPSHGHSLPALSPDMSSSLSFFVCATTGQE